MCYILVAPRLTSLLHVSSKHASSRTRDDRRSTARPVSIGDRTSYPNDISKNDKSATEDIEGMLDSDSSDCSLRLQKVFSRNVSIGNKTNNSNRSKRGSPQQFPAKLEIGAVRRQRRRPARLSRPSAPSVRRWPPSLELAHEAPIFHLRSP